MDESKLIQQMQKGDTGVLERIVRQYTPYAGAGACWEFDDPADADKVAGIAFGYRFILIEGDTALPGYRLTELPQ